MASTLLLSLSQHIISNTPQTASNLLTTHCTRFKSHYRTSSLQVPLKSLHRPQERALSIFGRIQHFHTINAEYPSQYATDNIGSSSSRERITFTRPLYYQWLHLRFPTTCGNVETALLVISSRLLRVSAQHARIHETIKSDAVLILANILRAPVRSPSGSICTMTRLCL